MQAAGNSSILALDVGSKRVGVAIASSVARLPRSLVTLTYDAELWSELEKIVANEQVSDIVVGLPRGLDGQETGQTEIVRDFVRELEQRLSLPVYLQDEAVTSRQARKELDERGKTYEKGAIDALAAVYILEDFLQENPGGKR